MSIDSPSLLAHIPVVGGSGRSQAFPCAAGEDIELEVVAERATEGASITVGVSWSDDGRTFAPSGETPDLFDALSGDDEGAGSASKSFTAKGNFYRLTWSMTGDSPSMTVDLFQSIPQVVESKENSTKLDAGAVEAPVATAKTTTDPAPTPVTPNAGVGSVTAPSSAPSNGPSNA